MPAWGGTETIGLTRLTGLAGPSGSGTAIFRADLSTLAADQVFSIRLFDSGSGLGGSSGQYSGFDLDAIRISTTFATTAGQASLAPGLDVFDFSPAGTTLTPGTQRPPADPKLNGTDPTGLNVDPALATLGDFDGIFFGTGSVTLGDAGSIAFDLTSPVPTAGTYIYLGELSGDPGEEIAGVLEVVTTSLTGDYDGSGQVEQGDLNLVLNNWGQPRPFEANGEPFATAQVDQEELNRVLNNWGSSTAPSFAGFESIPEPAGLVALAGFALCGTRRRE
ncbi:MAG: hypothetical protein AAF916_03695 [Planctomycetota bacterium]